MKTNGFWPTISVVLLAQLRHFRNALEREDLDALRLSPKSDLHNHGILGGDRAFLRYRTGRDIASLERKLTSIGEMHA